MKVRAYAKVNLALDVVRKREDGYHDLEMIMAPITLHDLIYINVIDEGIEIESNSKIVPTDQRNIMYKVAQLMQERYGLKKGVKIFVYKHIPTQAGLAGGSADGAAVIKAMNKLFHLNLSYEEMAALGKEVGADIPFCIYEKTAWKDGKIVFRNASLEDVFHQLSRRYNVDIVFHDDYKLSDGYRCRVTFTDETIQQIFGYLEIAAPIRWTVSTPVQKNDSTLVRQRVDVWLKKK